MLHLPGQLVFGPKLFADAVEGFGQQVADGAQGFAHDLADFAVGEAVFEFETAGLALVIGQGIEDLEHDLARFVLRRDRAFTGEAPEGGQPDVTWLGEWRGKGTRVEVKLGSTNVPANLLPQDSGTADRIVAGT